MQTCTQNPSAAATNAAIVNAQPVGPLFPLGHVCATPGALDLLEQNGENWLFYLGRHVTGDWSEMCAEDQRSNREAVKHGSRVFSAYATKDCKSLWIITEADRSVTTLLLPSEY